MCRQGRFSHHAAVLVGGVGFQGEVGVLRRRQDVLVVPAKPRILQESHSISSAVEFQDSGNHRKGVKVNFSLGDVEFDR